MRQNSQHLRSISCDIPYVLTFFVSYSPLFLYQTTKKWHGVNDGRHVQLSLPLNIAWWDKIHYNYNSKHVFKPGFPKLDTSPLLNNSKPKHKINLVPVLFISKLINYGYQSFFFKKIFCIVYSEFWVMVPDSLNFSYSTQKRHKGLTIPFQRWWWYLCCSPLYYNAKLSIHFTLDVSFEEVEAGEF